MKLPTLKVLTDFQNALHPGGVQAQRIADLWHLTLVICSVVFLAILIALFVALWHGSRHREAVPNLQGLNNGEPDIFKSVLAAVGLTGVLLFVLIAADFLTSRALAKLPVENALQIELTGHQWWWEARYLNADVSKIFSTANELHIPVGQAVVITLRSSDVIHSFWVPNLHGKKDMIPGQDAFIRFRADEPGKYRGQCAEFCGFEHALMALTVTAEPHAQFDEWLKQQQQSGAEPADQLQAKGRAVFLSSTCATCHAIQGTGASAVAGPDLTHIGSRETLAAGSTPNDSDHLRQWILDPQKIKRGANMPANPFSSDDLNALVAYLGNLK